MAHPQNIPDNTTLNHDLLKWCIFVTISHITTTVSDRSIFHIKTLNHDLLNYPASLHALKTKAEFWDGTLSSIYSLVEDAFQLTEQFRFSTNKKFIFEVETILKTMEAARDFIRYLILYGDLLKNSEVTEFIKIKSLEFIGKFRASYSYPDYLDMLENIWRHLRQKAQLV